MMNDYKIVTGDIKNTHTAIIKLKNKDDKKKITLELEINNNQMFDKQILKKVNKQLELEKVLDEYHIEELHYIKYALNNVVKKIND